MKQQVFWMPCDIDLPKVSVVVIRNPDGEKIADSVMWARERLGPSSRNDIERSSRSGSDISGTEWDYMPSWLIEPGSKDLFFYFGEKVDPDTILLFKLTFGGL